MNGDEASWRLSADETLWTRECGGSATTEIALVALLRVRDEELILEDTLTHLAGFADLICAYEDASTDRTRQILRAHQKVGMVIQNDRWLSGADNRLRAETRHRGLLLQEARRRWTFHWCMCCDADERYIGSIREFVTGSLEDKPDAVRVQLFDAYMTPDDLQPYPRGEPLLNFRRYFGPERRDILMLWKNSDSVRYAGLDAREPVLSGTEEVKFQCQHYGKSLSVEHWEATCEYYVRNFPWDPYGKKWMSRKGRAIHELSDFGRPLYRWGPELFEHAVALS